MRENVAEESRRAHRRAGRAVIDFEALGFVRGPLVIMMKTQEDGSRSSDDRRRLLESPVMSCSGPATAFHHRHFHAYLDGFMFQIRHTFLSDDSF